MKDAPQITHESTKLQKKYRGPLVINKLYPGDTYGVNNFQLDSRGHRYASTAHASQLRCWTPETSEETSKDDDNSDGENEKSFEPESENRQSTLSHQNQNKANTDYESGNSVSEEDENQQTERPRRTVRPPKRYNDYVM